MDLNIFPELMQRLFAAGVIAFAASVILLTLPRERW